MAGDDIEAAKLADEDELVRGLLSAVELDQAARRRIETAAVALVEAVRARKSEQSLLDTFLKQYGLANDEGVALMCLAEALLRIPDAQTADALIADKLVPANFAERLGDSDSVFVNASTWGLVLTGRVIAMDQAAGAAEWLGRLVSRAGEPVIRTALRGAMGLLGQEFVLGGSIEAALGRAAREGVERGSFDMLGEGARTAADADRYLELYAHAIDAVGAAGGDHGVSVKLSALHPRYEHRQRQRVMGELYPRLRVLAERALQAGVQLTIDAEEADRLALSLALFERLVREPRLRGQGSFGMVVQAYGKRAPALISHLNDLARDTTAVFPVRLVKGAYWDAEIKHAQSAGLADFPVFTRKTNTDLSYLACADQLLAAPHLFGQFATHNAHTVAAVMHLGAGHSFEFQRLHGMGELLYRVAGEHYDEFPPLRVYAPVGGHQDLLPYLVRRLLENGANSSFVNRFLDKDTPAAQVVADPWEACAAQRQHRHPRIRLPSELYGEARANSPGLDFASALETERLTADLERLRGTRYDLAPASGDAMLVVRNPARPEEVVGQVQVSSPAEVRAAFAAASSAQPAWEARGASERAGCLRALADGLLAERALLMDLLVREAGRNLVDADAEIREAVDFCRYYAAEAERLCGRARLLPGPTGELNELTYRGRGVFACISPWNFPLAIFLGQAAAALAAGNGVVAKPAEQTPLIAERVLKLAHAADIDAATFSVVQGDAAVGRAMIEEPLCAGVAFTGSTAVARDIQRALAARDGEIVPLVAETGGQNAMIVDSSALLEQVADDVVTSAFSSAGQRCSALRVLYLQEDIAERALTLIRGAVAELRLGDPADLATDVGPVISAAARDGLLEHVSAMRAAGLKVSQPTPVPAGLAGHFVAPTLVELDALSRLTDEQFGPILHVLTFPAGGIEAVLSEIRGTGFGLTLGLHSRIEHHRALVRGASGAGNVYVNRNMIGAVVGVQPFGGRGLSGTGPKAGGPDYLRRFAWEQTLSVNTTAEGGNVELLRDAPAG